MRAPSATSFIALLLTVMSLESLSVCNRQCTHFVRNENRDRDRCSQSRLPLEIRRASECHDVEAISNTAVLVGALGLARGGVCLWPWGT